MALLAPLALLWLGSVAALLWLWRLAATRRRTRVPSLVPFAHLVRRPPRRRSRLFINLLFWLQLAALVILAVVLAQPVWFRAATKTVLVVVDTSASMEARGRGASVFQRGLRQLRARLARQGPSESWFVVASAPVVAVTPEVTSNRARLRQAIESLRVSHLAGNLETAAHIGRALLDGRVDETLVITDEPRPEPPLGSSVEFITVGEPLANVAIVGLDAHGPLCRKGAGRVTVTVENFSKDPVEARLTAVQGRRVLAESDVPLGASERRGVALALPEGTDRWVQVELTAPLDALAVDNRAQVLVREAGALPVVLRSDRPVFREVLGGWLDACEGLAWTDALPDPVTTPYLAVTDGEPVYGPHVAGTLQWVAPKAPARLTLAHWMVAGEHAIGSYLSEVELVPATLGITPELDPVAVGEPVVWGLLDGRRMPIVMATQLEGQRSVTFFVDPSSSPESTPLVVLFFNSLRWLMGQADVVRAGEPLVVPSLRAGPVTVVRPDGRVTRRVHPGGMFRYEAATRAGAYRIVRGGTELIHVVNFLDPLESNLMTRSSSWRRAEPRARAEQEESPQTIQPLAGLLMLVILACLLGEWWLYSRKSP